MCVCLCVEELLLIASLKSGVLFSPISPGWSHPGDIWYNCLSRFRFDGINNNNNSLSFIFFLFASEKIHSQCSNQKVEKKIIRDELRDTTNSSLALSSLS